MSINKMGLNEMWVDEMEVDEMGINHTEQGLNLKPKVTLQF